MPDQNIQWHPGFYAGMELELKSYHLAFEREHQLTRGPLSIDLLIIKKLSNHSIPFPGCLSERNGRTAEIAWLYDHR